MFSPETIEDIRAKIKRSIFSNKDAFQQLREDIAKLKRKERRINPRGATAIALVATDGGNNKFYFDPFYIQVLRVVDSSENELFLKVISSETDLDSLSRSHFDRHGDPVDVLGELMKDLGIDHLSDLSYMLKKEEDGRPANSEWVSVYRQLIEWAVLYKLVTKKDYGTDTLVLFDGMFRTKVFRTGLFPQIRMKMKEAIEKNRAKNKREIYLAGIAKRNQVLTRYKMVMLLEKVLYTNYPSYVEVPAELEKKIYKWDSYTSLTQQERESAKMKDFVGGHLFFVKFGPKCLDPIWAIDIFEYQKEEAPKILGYMLSDANNGFPVPYYPYSLQKAHNFAAMVDLDYDILQTHIYEAVREMLGEEGDVLDLFSLIDVDPASKRYERSVG